MARPAARAGRGRSRRPRAEPPLRRAGLTGRAAVLVLVVCALVVSALLPLREFLAQRGEIGKLRQQQAQAKTRVDELVAEKARLAEPAYVAAEARRHLHFVLPGETAYVLLTPTPAPDAPGASRAGPGSPAGTEAPWYSQVWGSVQAADVQPPAAEPSVP